jgi:hypothetical protein
MAGVLEVQGSGVEAVSRDNMVWVISLAMAGDSGEKVIVLFVSQTFNAFRSREPRAGDAELVPEADFPQIFLLLKRELGLILEFRRPAPIICQEGQPAVSRPGHLPAAVGFS